jgi:hypothetical protein
MHKLLGFMTTMIFMSLVGLFLVPSVCAAEGGYSFLGTWGTYGSGDGQFYYRAMFMLLTR